MNVLISMTLFFLFYVCIKRTKYDKTFLMGIYLSKILNNKILCLFNKIVQNILVYRYNSVIQLKIYLKNSKINAKPSPFIIIPY